jgi:putative transcriptional regulator
MPTGSNLKKPSPNSKKRSQAVTGQQSQLASELVKGLRQAAAHFRGETTLRSYEYRIPERIDVRAVRTKAGLSQNEFAARYALNLRTVQEWEQGRSEPDLATRAYLTVIDKNPQAVEEALATTA